MEKKYVKMNISNDELSFGNFCRLMKEYAIYKKMAGQGDIFSIIIGIDASDSAINNYCVGMRSIGIEYKDNFRKRFDKDISNIILELSNILTGKLSYITDEQEIKKEVNNIRSIQKLSNDLYNISKNDKSVIPMFSKKLKEYIDHNNYYDVLKDVIYYIILEKKQPIYTYEANKDMLEELLNDTNISVNELEKFLKLQMQDGINYTYSLKKLAQEKNAYASYEMGEMEYKGEMTGYPRYIEAYNYFKVAADNGHPRACFRIGQMLLNGLIGNKTKEDLDKAFKYFSKASDLGSIAGINSMGLFYLNGLGSVKKDQEKALEYFSKAANYNYVYAFNNIGKYYEDQKDYEKAYSYFLKSANLNESWACNKVGEYLRKGIIKEENNIKKAFDYYNKAINVPISLMDKYALYNLAKYYYKDGNFHSNTPKDLKKAINYFEKSNLKESLEELLIIYKDLLKETNDPKYITKLKEIIYKMGLNGYSKKEIEEKLDHLLIIKEVEINE